MLSGVVWKVPGTAASLAMFAVLGACSVATTMVATPGPHPATRPVPVAGTDLFDWKGVVHCHSHLSHDSEGTIAEIAAAAHTAHDDFVVMTDHQTAASVHDGQRGMVGDTLFVVGCELRSPQGTVMAFPLREPLVHWQHAALLVKEAAAQGAIVLMCHAEAWKDWQVPGITGIEVVNLHAGVLAKPKVATLLTGLLLPLRLLFQHICHRDAVIFRRWDEVLALRHPFTPVGGNDAHANIRTLGPLGGTIGNYREVFLTLSTHVLAPRLTEQDLVEAMRLGRTYVAFDVFGEGAGFDFRATSDGTVHLPGDTVTAAKGLALRVTTPSPGQIELFCDGAIVARSEAATLTLDTPPPGIYRVEVRTPAGTPWLFSSSIRVQAP